VHARAHASLLAIRFSLLVLQVASGVSTGGHMISDTCAARYERDLSLSSSADVAGRRSTPLLTTTSSWYPYPYQAGHASVSVEYLDDTAATFGRGKRTTMRFGEFLSRLRTGRYYISSSQQRIGPHGFPDLMVSPLVELGKDLPSRLSWAGNLVPQQVNIWFGSSSSVDGVSSGLHHDYHDNFYVLLRGRKRFRLFPPGEVGRMQTYGEVVRVHENGRIVYKGQVGIGRGWVWGYGGREQDSTLTHATRFARSTGGDECGRVSSARRELVL